MAQKGEAGSIDMQRQQFLAARVSIFGSLLLFLLLAAVGILVDSITLILDASSSLVILVTAFLMRFSVNKIHRPPDDLYHFGYHKYEPLTAAIQNVLIIATCVTSIKFAIQDIVNPDDVHSYGLPVVATFAAGVIGLFITGYLRRTARVTDSQMVKAASVHWLADTALSIGVFAGFCFGFLLQSLGYTTITPYVDPVMAILLAVLLMFMPIKVGMHSLLELLDASPAADVHARINEVIDRYRPQLSGIDRLRIRKAGLKIFLDVCFRVRRDWTVAQVEELSHRFEREIKAELPDSDVVVWFRPEEA
jgi:cation diffusion facilitator family transporter